MNFELKNLILELKNKVFCDMNLISIPLVDWSNGIIMIAVFAFVVIAMIAVLVSLMNSGKRR